MHIMFSLPVFYHKALSLLHLIDLEEQYIAKKLVFVILDEWSKFNHFAMICRCLQFFFLILSYFLYRIGTFYTC